MSSPLRASTPQPTATKPPARGHVVLARSDQGGPGAVARRAADELRHRGWAVSEVVVAERGLPVLAALSAALSQRRALRDADVVHVELGALDLATFWFALLVGSRRAKILVAHDAPAIVLAPATALVGHGTRWRDVIGHRVLAPLLDGVLRRRLARGTAVGVVFTSQARDVWRSSGPRQIVVIDHGADRPSPDRRRPSAGLHVLYAGFISPGKGVDVLLDAWARVGATSPVPLVIAGTHTGGQQDARYALHLRERSREAVPPPEWHGWVSDPDLDRLMASAAVVVVPYRRSNPASGIVVRAMVQGRPIIATRVPAALDALEDECDGLLVAPGDVDALASALDRLLHDPRRRDELGDAAARQAATRFTWERHIDGLEAAYASAQAQRHQAQERRRGRRRG